MTDLILLQARELLAAEIPFGADSVRSGKYDTDPAIRAIIEALRTADTAAPVLPEVTKADVNAAFQAYCDATPDSDERISLMAFDAALNAYRDRVTGK